MEANIDSATTTTSTATESNGISNGHCIVENGDSNGHIQNGIDSVSSLQLSSQKITSTSKISFIRSFTSLFIFNRSSSTSQPKAAPEITRNKQSPNTNPSMISSACRILSRSKYYLSSLRAESFTISLIPVLLGAMLAYKVTGQFSVGILGATVVTVLSVHAAGNLVNTYCDFMRGIDSKERKSDDRTLVDSILTPEEVINLGVLFYVIGCIFFLAVVLMSPARMELLALMYFGGISSSFLYTGGIGLKYIALGDIIIMITFGPVSVLYSFIAQSGTIRLVTLLYAIPLALNAEAILHSNNTRDIEDDRKAGCVTIAVLIGHSASHFLFALLLFVPYMFLLVCSFHSSIWLLLPLITLPMAFNLEKMFRDGKLRYLPRLMGKLSLYFGMFYLLAVGLSNPHKLPGLFQF